jgi:general L-amino acid transport system permease protein
MRHLLRRSALFGSPLNTAVTLACAAILATALPGTLRWAVFAAAWSGGPAACRAAAGACWPYVGHKLGFFIFGFYPAEMRWRPLTALAMLFALIGATLMPAFWNRRLLVLWPAGLLAALWLLGDGLLDPAVPADSWSGLPLTVLLASFALVLGFPVGVLLALGRTSRLPFYRLLATAFVEVLRGLPLVSVLFMASVMIPLLTPAGITPGKLLRAYLGLMLVAAAFIAEAVRGGLAAVPPGQAEAATALGLGYWRTMRLVVMPQCLRVSVPPLVGVAIALFKDTALVTVIGLTDFLGAVGAGARDPAWLGYDVEGYCFAALVYFLCCFSASRYAAWLERRMHAGAPSRARGETAQLTDLTLQAEASAA